LRKKKKLAGAEKTFFCFSWGVLFGASP